MEKESKDQKIWVTASETINLGNYENIKIEAGYSKVYEESEDPIELLEEGVKHVTKVLKSKAKKIKYKRRRD